ncbi:hypothetical protein HHK36_014242 [Tetracentron sinense]|uniref:Protein kinase domain-containing protein n=1 Tax=Tetracentron sinense TaxID=13715 RepID=A0A835DI32_TETSI|nr:hypothetical protein HHK36_014242 [Tetracentron sinense]
MSAVAGSFGYLAPEYVYTTKVNEKVDVYCFGVVLLELATGREASNRDDEYMLAEWAWRYLQDGNSIADALYEKVKEPCYLDEMSAVFNLGIICTATLPSKRPSMKEVLQILLRCGPLQAYGENKAGNDYDAAPLLTTTDCLSNYRHSRRRRTSEDVDDDDNLACIREGLGNTSGTNQAETKIGEDEREERVAADGATSPEMKVMVDRGKGVDNGVAGMVKLAGEDGGREKEQEGR